MANCERLFLDYSVRKLRQQAGRIDHCLKRLNDNLVWARGAECENSIANLVLHLSGNVRQWIVSGVGGKSDARDRDAEFAARRSVGATELADRMRETIQEAAAVIEALEPERLGEPLVIQNYPVTVLEAIYHVVEHFSGHAAQIMFITKLLTREDLGFHEHLETTAPHSERTP